MKKIIRLGIMVLLIVLTLNLASCKQNISATGTLTVVEASRKTLELKVEIQDDKEEITISSVRVALYDEDNNTAASQTCSNILKTTDDVRVTEETVVLTSLKANTTYTATLTCTVGDSAVTLAEIEVSTTSNGDSEDTPIMIRTQEDVTKIKNDLTGVYKLANDIDLSSEDAQTEWTALFTSSSTSKFTGTFDGDGHTISNFKQTTSTSYYGFFGYLSGKAVIKNLTIENVSIKANRYSDSYVGILAGWISRDVVIDNVTIKNCDITMSTTSSQTLNMYIGGLAGYNEGGTITNTKVEDVEIQATTALYTYVGGFVGYNLSSNRNYIENCGANATITVNQTTDRTALTESNLILQNIGGFVGFNGNSGNIRDSYSEGSISGTLALSQNPEDINRNQNVQIGGFVGMNLGVIGGSASSNSIYFKSFDAYRVSIGTFCGYLYDSFSELSNCVYIGTNTNITIVLVSGDNGETSTEENDYERIYNIGVVGFVGDNAEDVVVYSKGPSSVIMSSEVVEYSFDNLTVDYTTFELTEEVLAKIAEFLVLKPVETE